MKITEITVGWKETCSIPGEYSNVTPEVTLTASLNDLDDDTKARNELLQTAKRTVQEQINDILERHGESPKYSDEPLYRLRYSRDEKVYVIVPNLEDLLLQMREYGGFFDIMGIGRLRLAAIPCAPTLSRVNSPTTAVTLSEQRARSPPTKP